MKKRIWKTAAAVTALLALYMFGTGFVKQGTAYIDSYCISPDGTEMTIQIGVASSAGFIREVTARQQQGGKLYLDCYAAFGGVNGAIGAKSQYTIPIEEATETVALYRSANTYEEVLIKDEHGSWQRA